MKKVKSFLKIVLGTVLGAIAFLLIRDLTVYLISLLGKIPYVGLVLYWPSAFPILAKVLPPLAGISVASFTAKSLGRTSRPLGILLIAYYIYEVLSPLIAGVFSWQSLLASVIGILLSLICIK